MTLASIQKGKIKRDEFILVYGSSGVGKTTLAADAPAPIFIDTEEGSGSLDVARFPKPKTFTEVIEMLTSLLTEKHNYKTLVVDSLDHLEPLIWAEVCEENKVKDIGDLPYGRGYSLALGKWQKFIELCRKLRDK